MGKDNTKPYDVVSLVYRELMKNVDYKKWSKYIIDLLEDHIGKKKPRILELGAGSCKIADTVKRKFKHYIASDISFPMLKQCSAVKMSKVCCDMTSLPFNNRFDVIFSTFDSVNYLLSTNNLLTLFQEVKRVLQDDGIFTFDVSLERNSLGFEKVYTLEGTYKGYNFIRKSKYYPGSRIHKNIFNITDKNGRIMQEVHRQKIFKFETYFDMISKAGLYVVECLEAFTFNNGSSNSDRVQFVLKSDRSNVKF